MSEQPVEVVPVVTLFESFGAGAEAIGRRVAEQIGFPFHEQAFSSEQLEENPRDRNQEDTLTKVYAAMAGRGFAGLSHHDPGGGVRELQRDQYDVVMQNTRTVMEWGAQGGVIVGRNGALILHDLPGALHVRVDAPVAWRIEQAAARTGIGEKQAAKRQKREDDIRAEMSIKLYGWDPREINNYDLVINAAELDVEAAATIIVDALRIKTAAAAAPA